jgi:hypothetical protein
MGGVVGTVAAKSHFLSLTSRITESSFSGCEEEGGRREAGGGRREGLRN